MSKILLILIFPLEIITVCRQGCLKCSNSDVCLLCDGTNKYYLDLNGECWTKDSLNNCLKTDLYGTCLLCQPAYFLNSSNKQCVLLQ